MTSPPPPAGSPAAPSGSPAPRQAWGRLVLLALAGLLSLAVVATLSHTLLQIGRRPFDQRPRELLKRQKPHVVFIGNSMVYTRFDERTLNQLVRPTRVHLLATSAAQSALWYAKLKYTVAASRVPVRRVAIFF